MKKFLIGIDAECDRGSVFETLVKKDKKFLASDLYVNDAPENLINFCIKRDLDLQVSQLWYVKFNDNLSLIKKIITNLTEKTVTLKDPHNEHAHEYVYKICDVEMVEKIKEN